MGSVDKANAHQSILCAKNIGVNLLQFIPSNIVITISGRAGEIAFGHPVLLKGRKHLLRVYFGNGVDALKLFPQISLGLRAQLTYFF